MGNDMNAYIQGRRELADMLGVYTFGPGAEGAVPDLEHEVLTTAPMYRYSTGMLFPQSEELQAAGADNHADMSDMPESSEDTALKRPGLDKLEEEYSEREETEEDSFFNEDRDEFSKEEMNLATQMKPSSCGMIFFVRGKADTLRCQVDYATYRKTVPSDCVQPVSHFDFSYEDLPEGLRSVFAPDVDGQYYTLLQNMNNIESLQELLTENGLEPKENRDLYNCLGLLRAQCRDGYKREAHHETVDLCSDTEGKLRGVDLKEACLKLSVICKQMKEDIHIITLMLQNTAVKSEEDSDRAHVETVIAQTELRVLTEDNTFVFVSKDEAEEISASLEEDRQLAMLYRKEKNYGTGMGTGITWEIDAEGKGVLRTNYLPEAEVPASDFELRESMFAPGMTDEERKAEKRKLLSMKYYSDLDKESLELKLHYLHRLIEDYGSWIDELGNALPEGYEATAEGNLKLCREAQMRMEHGLAILASNGEAARAFELANRAMFIQRIHAALGAETHSQREEFLRNWFARRDYTAENDEKHWWRPFQLAFLLLSIPGIVEADSDDRRLLDLIWFPTGGGKTEAYLGLSAFVIFYRRLAYPDSYGGTNIMMRYTLRLLTAQQFTRAATLICACELIRREAVKHGDSSLGSEEISIGLWIGGNHTPNKLKGEKGAEAHLKELLTAGAEGLRRAQEKHNKFQLLKCPWCGTPLVKSTVSKDDTLQLTGEWGYRIEEEGVFFFCPDEACDFHGTSVQGSGALPVRVIDEMLYKKPTTLLIGTVDKFAMLAWKAEAETFFGVGSDNRAPELIIQDELHLISGPVGTMVGLYETAVEELCHIKGIDPKIIASTATIRRAANQCREVFNRPMRQFPPRAIDYDDAYFSRMKKPDTDGNFGRLYVGIMASDKNMATMEVRVLAALLQSVAGLQGSNEERTQAIRDAFWTMTIYFNNLGELGRGSRLLVDDIPQELMAMGKRRREHYRRLYQLRELTSRVSSSELNRILKELEGGQYSLRKQEGMPYPIDAVVSSNMISVGIDVARLNLMAVAGQPKLTSEYIQATSRVGRTTPGLVITIYNGARSRDRSYYEQFVPFHKSFYRFVEPTGATPFSKPARDRALHAILTMLMRALEPELHGEAGAKNFSAQKYRQRITQLEAIVLKRMQDIRRETNPNSRDDTAIAEKEIKTFFRHWDAWAHNAPHGFAYGERFQVKPPKQKEGGRLLRPYEQTANDNAIPTMRSMRNVDKSAIGEVIRLKGVKSK